MSFFLFALIVMFVLSSTIPPQSKKRSRLDFQAAMIEVSEPLPQAESPLAAWTNSELNLSLHQLKLTTHEKEMTSVAASATEKKKEEEESDRLSSDWGFFVDIDTDEIQDLSAFERNPK